MNEDRRKLRDEVYSQMMLAQARLSKDANTQMGAVLVSGDGRVLSTGYNGAPKGFDDSTVPYTREKQKLAYDLLDADSGELISHHEFEANKYPYGSRRNQRPALCARKSAAGFQIVCHRFSL